MVNYAYSLARLWIGEECSNRSADMDIRSVTQLVRGNCVVGSNPTAPFVVAESLEYAMKKETERLNTPT